MFKSIARIVSLFNPCNRLHWAPILLDLLQSLHVVDSGDLPDAVDDFLEMFQVGDFQDYVYAGSAVLATGFHAADVGFGVADDGGDLFEHAPAVITEKREFYGIGNGLAVFVSGPKDVDAAVGFVEKIGDVGTVDGVDGNAFAAGDVADDGFAPNGVATAGAIDEQVALSADDDGVRVAAKDAADNASQSAGKAVGRSLLFAVGHRFS